MSGEDFKKCIEFHGHVCPGVSLGYRAAKAALEWLKENRSEDEELVAIVETDACCADAVQVLTGCTFGKGNFICRDYGKHVFIFLSRNSGRGVRISLRDGAVRPSERHRAILRKLADGAATPQEQEEFQRLHVAKAREVLEMPLEDLFSVRAATVDLPPKAKIEDSKPCARCGEPTMASRLTEVEGRLLCRDCL
jgi:formylmethanofuran dehydrogenase subunit E